MRRSRPRATTVVLTVVALVALSGVAMAATDEDNDTVINYGYDETSQFFIWNVTSLDYEPNYSALAETLFGDDIDALLEACSLSASEGEEPIVHGYSFDGETITLLDGEGEPVEDGDCGPLVGGYVTGPQGQVNHGMFMRLVNALYDGPNRGCVLSRIAQSKLGKDSQQVLADPEFAPAEDPEPIEGGEVVFTTVETSCQHGPGKNVGEDADHDGGPPAHVLDKWGEDGPGNSGH